MNKAKSILVMNVDIEVLCFGHSSAYITYMQIRHILYGFDESELSMTLLIKI